MKFNWGWGILLTCIGFVLFMSSLVYRATREKIEFVTENYYDKELQFQDQIDREAHTAALADKIKVAFSAGSNEVVIKYPAEIDFRELTGEISFFKPDDASQDFEIPVRSDESNFQVIGTGGMKRGWWKIKLDWTAKDVQYYSEQKVFVN